MRTQMVAACKATECPLNSEGWAERYSSRFLFRQMTSLVLDNSFDWQPYQLTVMLAIMHPQANSGMGL